MFFHKSCLILGPFSSGEPKAHLIMPTEIYSSFPKSLQSVPPSGMTSSDNSGTSSDALSSPSLEESARIIPSGIPTIDHSGTSRHKYSL